MIWIEIDKTKKLPLIRQVYQQLRSKILNGQLKSGDKLPSSRELAIFLHISRNVILEAYNLLLLEGYIISKPSIGTFVAEGILLDNTLTTPSQNFSSSLLSKNSISNEKNIDFRSGIPALDLFPLKKWYTLESQLALETSPNCFDYGTPQGTPELRTSICTYLQRTRGLICDPSQIIITSGSIQSFSLLSKLLLTQDTSYIIEDPLHYEIRKTFEATSINHYSVPVDEQGILTAFLPENINPSFIFVTPSHQYPLGGLLSIQRRIELIRYAEEKNCYIIEDDYDSEFHYLGSPVSALYDLAPNRVIYVGTFSKILSPSLRIGYMILPYELVDCICEYKKRSDYFTNTLNQLLLSKFIDNMYLNKHILKMRKLYFKRHNTLIESLLSTFDISVTIQGESTGLHLIAMFKHVEFTEPLIKFLYQNGVAIYPIWIHSLRKDYPKNSIILGYSHLSCEMIQKGIALLKENLIVWYNQIDNSNNG